MRVDEPLPPLSEAQIEIMGVVWDRGEATVADVWKALAGRRQVARSTVLTMLTRLEEKGWLCSDQEMAGTPSATVRQLPRETTMGTVVRRLVDSAFGGSAEGLVLALLHGRGISQEEARKIKKMIDRAEGKK